VEVGAHRYALKLSARPGIGLHAVDKRLAPPALRPAEATSSTTVKGSSSVAAVSLSG
jgi:hypothetical protein